MMTWLVVAVIVAAIGVFLWWQYRGDGAAFLEPALQWWDRLRDRWASRGTEPVPAVVPAPAAAPSAPLPPPPATLPPPETGAPAGAPSAGGAQSDLLYAIDALVAEASHGDIRAVRRVVATLSQATTGMGSALRRLGQRLGEPDKDYGPEVFEPAMSAGSQCSSAGMRLAEADALLLSLIGATVGELADSPRRAPHSSQLNGGN